MRGDDGWGIRRLRRVLLYLSFVTTLNFILLVLTLTGVVT